MSWRSANRLHHGNRLGVFVGVAARRRLRRFHVQGDGVAAAWASVALFHAILRRPRIGVPGLLMSNHVSHNSDGCLPSLTA